MRVRVGRQLVDDVDERGEDAAGERTWWTLAWVAVGLGVVVRLWGLGGHDLTFDEAFTASAARKPAGQLLDFLRTNDTHPPMDYLIRAPFASTGSDLVVRLPSVVFSVATLLLLAWWMRPRGRFGAFTAMVAAVMPFLVLHGREARMYSLVMFLGVVAAVCADRWLSKPSLAASAGVAGSGLLAMLSHSATIPAVGAFFLVPGLRRDADAWRFRAVFAGAFGVWVGVWGPSFREQALVVSSFWIPLSSADWVETVGAALLTTRSALVHIAFGALVTGVLCLLARRDRTAWLGVLAFVLPAAAITIAGFEYHLLLPRSLAFGAWAVAASIGAGIEQLRIHLSWRGGVIGLLLAAALLVPSTLDVVRVGREDLVEFDVLRERLEPGDRISISPAWFRPLLQWNFVAKHGFRQVEDDPGGRFTIADPSGPPSGRTHLLDHTQLPRDEELDGVDGCEAPFEGSSWLLRCTREP